MTREEKLKLLKTRAVVSRSLSDENGLINAIKGLDGKDGKDGKDGAPGANGAPGLPGAYGKKGDTGQRGKPGSPGQRGLKGDKGETGRGINWRGAWATLTEYSVNDAVSINGSSFICVKNHKSLSKNKPSTDNREIWQLMAKKGDKGEKGEPGVGGGGGSSASSSNGLPAGGTEGQLLAKNSATDYDAEWVEPSAGSGSGDVSSNTSSSVDNEIALFSGTGGKTIKRATTTGLLKAAAGVITAAVAGTDYYNPGGTDVAVADGGTGSSTAAGALVNLGLSATAAELNYTDGVTSAIQTQLDGKQSLDAELTALAGLTSAADKGIQFTGSGTAGTFDLTAAGKALLDDANAAAQIATLGLDADIATFALPAGTTISAFGASLIDDAASSNARTTLGLGTIATQDANNVNISGGAIAGITDLAIADGGTGASTAANAFAALKQDASTTATGVVELATTVETDTGTDAVRAVTPDGLSGSVYGTKVVSIQVIDGATSLTTGDGKAYFRIPTALNGMDLISVAASVIAKSTSGTPTVQLARGRQANATSAHSFTDMLTTKVTIDANEFDSKDAAAAVAIDTANDDVVTGDLIRIDVDVAGTGTTGLFVTCAFRTP